MDTEQEIHIVIPTYNNGDRIERAIASALRQNYDNFKVYVYDDASTDDTAERVKKINDKKLIYRRYVNKTGSPTYYYKEHSYEANTRVVVAHLDGDDTLYHSGILSRLNEVYTPSTWMTYGQFINDKGDVGFCSEISNTRTYRYDRLLRASHLRTHRAGLFRLIADEDLKDGNGNYYYPSSDSSFMYPLIEMCGKEHIKFIDEILYWYDTSQHHIQSQEQHKRRMNNLKEIKEKPQYHQIEEYD